MVLKRHINKGDFEKAVQAIHYSLLKLGTVDKLKIIKLMFLADKYSLLHLSRTITQDRFLAMPAGPVGSMVKTIVDLDKDYLDEPSSALIERLFLYAGDTLSIKEVVEYDSLSNADKKIIDTIVDRFGSWSTKMKLIPYLHQFPEWYVHEQEVADSVFSTAKIGINEIFSVPTKDFDVSEAEANVSKEIFFGRY